MFYALDVRIKYPDAVTRMRVPDSLPTLSFEKRAISRGKIFIPKNIQKILLFRFQTCYNKGRYGKFMMA